jgi:hypothetical protein
MTPKVRRKFLEIAAHLADNFPKNEERQHH